jgi:hypothetical protein
MLIRWCGVCGLQSPQRACIAGNTNAAAGEGSEYAGFGSSSTGTVIVNARWSRCSGSGYAWFVGWSAVRFSTPSLTGSILIEIDQGSPLFCLPKTGTTPRLTVLNAPPLRYCSMESASFGDCDVVRASVPYAPEKAQEISVRASDSAGSETLS